MGYLFLTLALIGGLGKGFLGKYISNDVNNFRECIVVNALRMFFCSLVGAVVALPTSGLQIVTGYGLVICMLSAVSMTAFCVCWLYAYKTEAYMFLSVFTMLGTVITCLLSRIFLSETIKPLQWLGMVLVLIAIYIMSMYNKSISGKITAKGIGILLVGCLGSAVADFCQKLWVINVKLDGSVFNFYMYLFSFLILLLISVVLPKSKQQSNIMSKKYVVICFFISAFLYMNSFSKTVAAVFLPSAQIYPVLQGANLICSAVLARILLKEKITVKSVIGMVIAFVAIIIMKL